MPVIDDESGAVAALQPGRDRGHDGIAGRRDLEDRANRDGVSRRQEIGIDGGDAGGEAERVVCVEADHALAKTLFGLDELADGDGIEKLVGDEQQEAVGDLLEALVPGDLELVGDQGLALDLLQPLAGFDQMHARLFIKVRREARKHAQDIRHHRAAAGSDFRDRDRFRRSVPAPGLEQEHADEFAEQLADLGRGDEIAALSERLARAVVAMFRICEAEREIVGDADRARCQDERLDLVAERRGHRRPLRRALAWRARRIAQRPRPTIGSDRSMPIVSQPPAR